MFPAIPGVTVIGFGHRARHGKDSAARILIEQFPRLVQRFSFADDLYAYCRIAHGMTTKDGPLLQRVGVGMRETVDEAIWIRSVYSKLLDARPRVALITDVRFPNEVAFVRGLGGTSVRVERRLADGSLYRANDGRDPNHPTEVACAADDYWDRTIINPDGDLATFTARVTRLFADVGSAAGAFREVA
jgi:hypothetical protein